MLWENDPSSPTNKLGWGDKREIEREPIHWKNLLSNPNRFKVIFNVLKLFMYASCLVKLLKGWTLVCKNYEGSLKCIIFEIYYWFEILMFLLLIVLKYTSIYMS